MSVSKRDPPHDLEVECMVLGSILLGTVDPNDLGLEPTAFFDLRHRSIFAVARDIGAGLDASRLGAALARAGLLDGVGGLAYLVGLTETIPTAANVHHHAALVRERAQQRQILDAALAVARGAYALKPPDVLAAELEAAAQVSSGPAAGMGLVDLTKPAGEGPPLFRVGGTPALPSGEVALLIGRHDVEKTRLALSFALSVASGLPVHDWEPRSGTALYLGRASPEALRRRLAELVRRRSDLKRAVDEGRLLAVSQHGLHRQLVEDGRATPLLRRLVRLVERHAPRLVVLDGATALGPRALETEQAVADSFVRELERLTQICSSTVLLTHGVAKSASGPLDVAHARGVSALTEAIPWIAGVWRREDGGHRFQVLRCEGEPSKLGFDLGRLGLERARTLGRGLTSDLGPSP